MVSLDAACGNEPVREVQLGSAQHDRRDCLSVLKDCLRVPKDCLSVLDDGHDCLNVF